MKLSTRAKYGLKALIDLGLYSEKEAVSLQSIAGRQNISVSYLEQLMALLKKAGLVKSVRGAAGGYFRRHSFLRCALYAGLCPQGAEPPLHGTHLCRRAGPQNRAFHPDR